MCDTLFKRLSEKNFIFGKNSDRSANEPNLTLFVPAREGGSNLKCTYIEIPDAEKTYAVLLTKPSWIWGAEMGINEHGLVIGNEAVFTKSKGKKIESLIGMDFLRLALERTKTAKQAAELIIELLEKYGQGGNCGFGKNFFYDNSYLIADASGRALVLETAGKKWAIKKNKDFSCISNRLGIKDADECSNEDEKADFAKGNLEPVFSHFSGSKLRCMDSAEMLANPKFKLEDMMKALRRHHGEADDKKLFKAGSVQSVCMHQSTLGDHTTGSFIVSKADSKTTIWTTGCSTPCLSAFKPVYFGTIVPPVFGSEKESLGYWLEREYFLRAVYAGLINASEVRAEIAAMEKDFIAEDKKLRMKGAEASELEAFSLRCAERESAFIRSFKKEADAVKNGEAKLPGRWKKLTADLGKNVFGKDK